MSGIENPRSAERAYWPLKSAIEEDVVVLACCAEENCVENMSDSNSTSNGVSTAVRNVTGGMQPTKERERERRKCKSAICGILKKLDRAQGSCFVGTGSLVKDLCPQLKRNIHLVTSKEVIPSHNLNGYFLCFKTSKDEDKKPIELASVLNSSDEVIFTSGLTIIPVDSNNFKPWSGIVTYRQFPVDKESNDFSKHELYCHVVEEVGKSFVIKPFKLNGIATNQPYLTNVMNSYTFSNARDFCANNRMVLGAPIVKTDKNLPIAVGALTVENDQISPVLFSKLNIELNFSSK